MTHWWYWPIMAVVIGIYLAWQANKSGGGDYDFITPFLTFIAFAGGIVVAIAFIAGHYL